MEQQRLSVAKAGIVTTLNTRTVVIATCNCRGKYDVSQDISVNKNFNIKRKKSDDIFIYIFTLLLLCIINNKEMT